MVEFTLEGHVYIGESQGLGRDKHEDFVRVKEKYVCGESIDFKYNNLHEGKLAQTFIKVFGGEPEIPIYIKDDEFIEDDKPLYFLYIFGAVWIITGVITLFQ